MDTRKPAAHSRPVTRSISHHARRKPGPFRLFTMGLSPEVVVYELESPRWTARDLNVAVISDMHAIDPWSRLPRLSRVIDAINGMDVDIVFVLGDFIAPRVMPGSRRAAPEIMNVISRLTAPLGVYATLGNHDWSDDDKACENGFTRSSVEDALLDADLVPLINRAAEVPHGDDSFWVVGFDSQRGHLPINQGGARHDPEAAFADVPADKPAILLAHEPDYFVEGDPRPVLQISGHTHGGQANFFGWRPFTPSNYSDRYAYGHVTEGGQHLIVTGGLGYSHIPLRIGQPPEITLIRLTHGERNDIIRRLP